MELAWGWGNGYVLGGGNGGIEVEM
jgi:hypothetical protein